VFVGQISVAQAARRLGVSVSRIHQRIADGSLGAVRVGSQWVIDEASLLPLEEAKSPGRPLSLRSIWGLLALSLSEEDVLAAFAPVELSRNRDRLRRLLTEPDPAPLLRLWFRNRADRRRYRASPRDLPGLRTDTCLTPAGLSHPDSHMQANDLVEAYVPLARVDAVVDDHLLSPATTDRDTNVILHVAASTFDDLSGPLLLAADLADHRRPREEARAAELLREIPAP
jgi:excisionase family DNA binding protein